MRGCAKRIILDHVGSGNRHCEESALADDMAISWRGDSYTIEIATLPSVACDDNRLMEQPSCGFDIHLSQPINPNTPGRAIIEPFSR